MKSTYFFTGRHLFHDSESPVSADCHVSVSDYLNDVYHDDNVEKHTS